MAVAASTIFTVALVGASRAPAQSTPAPVPAEEPDVAVKGTFDPDDGAARETWMDAYEKKTGGKLLAIPHNANLSNGRMFEPVDFAGKVVTTNYAERRAQVPMKHQERAWTSPIRYSPS
jgi:hypothetical protein